MTKTIFAAALAALSAFSSTGSAFAYERWIDISNTSRSAVYSVNISDVGRNDWGPDLLGSEMIYPGEMMRVEPSRHRGFCRFDILITYQNGRSETLWDRDLCTMTDISV